MSRVANDGDSAGFRGGVEVNGGGRPRRMRWQIERN